MLLKKNFETRIKKLEELLLPQKNMVVLIICSTNGPESYFVVNGIKYSIPPEAYPEEFINQKYKTYGGVICAAVYLSESSTHFKINEDKNHV